MKVQRMRTTWYILIVFVLLFGPSSMESSLVMQELLTRCNKGEKRKDLYLDRMCSMIEREDPDLCDEDALKNYYFPLFSDDGNEMGRRKRSVQEIQSLPVELLVEVVSEFQLESIIILTEGLIFLIYPK